MIDLVRNIPNKFLIVVLQMYIISSYVCQETLLPTKINSLLLFVFIGLSILYTVRKKIYRVNIHFSIWYFVLFLYSLISSLLLYENVMPTLYQMFVVLILTFCFSVAITNKQILELTVITYVISAILMGFLIFYYNPVYLLGNLSGLNGVRLGAEETGNANIFTALMMFSGVFASWLFFFNKNNLLRIFSISSLVLILYLMALSGGRKTIIAVLACTFFFIWKKGGSSKKKKITAIVSICLVMSFLLYMLMNIPWLYDVVGYRFDGMFSFMEGTGESNVSSDDLRKKMIEIGIQGWTERPIFGHGLDSYKFYNLDVTGHLFYSHNNYVEMLYNFGIMGFLLYYIFIYRLYKKLISLPVEYYSYSILGLGVIIELLLFDIGGVAYYMNGNMIMLCIVSIIAYLPTLLNHK